MSEYVPTTEDVRADYAETYEGTNERRYARFDRWLAAIERDAAARALEKAASFLVPGETIDEAEVKRYLRARAAEIRERKSA